MARRKDNCEREAGEYPALSRFAGSPEDSGELEAVKTPDWSALTLISLIALLTATVAGALVLWRHFA
jgi:hypothetical protein